jgi:hypothetical protein
MMPPESFSHVTTDFEVEVWKHPCPDSAAFEAGMLDSGAAIPLAHRQGWVEASTGAPCWYVGVVDRRDETTHGFAVGCGRSRALPGHLILDATRVGSWGRVAAVAAGLEGLVAAARDHGRVLRLRVGLFSRDEGRRAELAEGLRAMSFTRSEFPRSYPETVVIDLEDDEETLFAGLHRKARRSIRTAGRRPVAVSPVDSPDMIPRLEELLRETMARTGGDVLPVNFRSILATCEGDPSLACIIGLFDTRKSGPDALVAYAVGLRQGDHVEYATAASTRSTDLRMPLAYVLMWDLIVWARSIGSAWFDLGGITAGSHADDSDPTGGISDFKRYFSPDHVTVGAEWILEPHPTRAAWARFTSRLVQAVRAAVPGG